jgi:uncharacterized phage-associated protein
MTRLTKLLKIEKKLFGKPFRAYRFVPKESGLYNGYERRVNLITSDRNAERIKDKPRVSGMIGAV